MGNAIKYTDAGGYVLCQVTIKAIGENLISCQTVISDNGIGMSPAFLPICLNPFPGKIPIKKCNPGNRTGNVHRQASDRQDGRNRYGGEQKGVGTIFTVTLLFEGLKEQECKKIEEEDQNGSFRNACASCRGQ
ncbi:MAG: ATP-binding protein [Gallintestinimicrobium sp.]